MAGSKLRPGGVPRLPIRPADVGFILLVPVDTLSNSRATALVASFSDQDTVFHRAFEILAQAIAGKCFPCASLALTHRGKLVGLKALGHLTYDPDSAEATTDTVFDLASVTKVAATTAMAMLLYERGLLKLDSPVIGILPEFASDDTSRREVTFRMLLAHSSGLPAYEKLFLRAQTKERLIEAAFNVRLKYSPGTRAEYSDIGFILLGLALERIAGEALDSFCQREIFGPLGMTKTTFDPPASWGGKIPPTADDKTFRKRIIQGEVQDENASVLGGVAGHAGVFSTAADVAVFAQCILNGGSPIFRSETLAIFTERELSERALGWDTPSQPSQSGKCFSSKSIGHLGYTGTSLWIDLERQISITLLTNRTWPDCSNQAIKQIRPRFHDAVMTALLDAGKIDAK